jgi:cytochrome c oxidase subunit 3
MTELHAALATQAVGHPPHLAHHFDTPQQQGEAGKLGMWLFLVTEILFFGGLFCAYAVYRAIHPEMFVFAHHYLDKNLGAVNTAVLIFSSLTMAWAVRCAQLNQRRGLVACLAITLVCAAVFLGVKYVEYSHKWHHGLLWAGWFKPVEAPADPAHAPSGEHGERPRDVGIFFSIYFLMTGLHGLHVVGGMGVIGWILVLAARGRFSSEDYAPVDFTALYWHLVDLIWIFLFPLLYLIGP